MFLWLKRNYPRECGFPLDCRCFLWTLFTLFSDLDVWGCFESVFGQLRRKDQLTPFWGILHFEEWTSTCVCERERERGTWERQREIGRGGGRGRECRAMPTSAHGSTAWKGATITIATTEAVAANTCSVKSWSSVAAAMPESEVSFTPTHSQKTVDVHWVCHHQSKFFDLGLVPYLKKKIFLSVCVCGFRWSHWTGSNN